MPAPVKTDMPPEVADFLAVHLRAHADQVEREAREAQRDLLEGPTVRLLRRQASRFATLAEDGGE